MKLVDKQLVLNVWMRTRGKVCLYAGARVIGNIGNTIRVGSGRIVRVVCS